MNEVSEKNNILEDAVIHESPIQQRCQRKRTPVFSPSQLQTFET